MSESAAARALREWPGYLAQKAADERRLDIERIEQERYENLVYDNDWDCAFNPEQRAALARILRHL